MQIHHELIKALTGRCIVLSSRLRNFGMVVVVDLMEVYGGEVCEGVLERAAHYNK